LQKPRQSEQNLSSAVQIYDSALSTSSTKDSLSSFEHMNTFLVELKQAVVESRPVTRDVEEEEQKVEEQADVEAIQEQIPSGQRSHVRSISSGVAAPSATTTAADPLGVLAPLSPTLDERSDPKDDGFE
jgi:CO dehydrogenase/acetyl-CoA synthase beta subunit